MRRTIKRNRYSKRRNTHRKQRKQSKGGGIGASKFPPLPPSPPSSPRINKPSILINNESLIPPKPESKEYLNRRARLLKMREGIYKQSWTNMIMGREHPKPKLNSYGYPKSVFTVNNKVGFTKHES